MFSHLVGNEEVKTRLIRLIESNRLPNSLLFAGPAGVGKKLFALELARSFVCQTTNGKGTCRQCPACDRVNEFNLPTSGKPDDFDAVFFSGHPDVGLVVPYKRNVRVGAIRALEVQANFRPFEARGRVFIVDDADKMNDAAANALLKTLEEPAESTYLVLVTSKPDSLLPTIRSRCQAIRFAPVSSTAIATMLREERKLSSDDAHLAAKVSGGSVGKAVELNIDDYRKERGVQFAIIRAALLDGDRSKLIMASERSNDAKNKDRFEENLAILEILLHDIWLIKNGSNREAICNFDIHADLVRDSEEIKKNTLAIFLSEIQKLREALDVNINRKMATDALFMKMSG